jgi:hypothetical protein
MLGVSPYLINMSFPLRLLPAATCPALKAHLNEVLSTAFFSL